VTMPATSKIIRACFLCKFKLSTDCSKHLQGIWREHG